MSDETYRTLGGSGQSRYRIRGSEFLGHAAPVESVGAAESFMETVGSTHPDATHTVSAYRIRADPFREYETDAGEPAGSAGKPALNVLKGRDLENVIVVVIRYYGGTNLGRGGLVRAYSRTVTEAVTDAGVVEAHPQELFTVTVAYDDSGTARGVLESAGVSFEADYGEQVTFEVRARASAATEVRDRLRSATRGRVDIE